MILLRGKNKVSKILKVPKVSAFLSPKATFTGQAKVIVFICFLLLLIPPIAFAVERNLNFSATVPAHPSDFQATMDLTDPSGSTFPQDTTLTYQLTYGSSLSYPVDITVEADWSLGTVQGSSTPSVDILDYVVGSASNGYNTTSPVVDTVNRKITWTISSFPGNTTKSVTFKLKTNSNYTAADLVSFSVKGLVLGPGTQTADNIVTKNYQKTVTPTPTVTNTPTPGPTDTPAPGPTSTPGPNPTNTPTPTPAVSKAFSIGAISVNAISAQNVTVTINLNQPATVKVAYGKTPATLTQELTDPTFSQSHTVTLEGLSKNTSYYFKVLTTNEDGTTITSDIFTLKTALSENDSVIDSSSLVVTAENVLLYDEKLAPVRVNQKPVIIIAAGTQFTFRFTVDAKSPITRVQAFLRSTKVLGLSTFIQQAEASSGSVEVLKSLPNVYTAKLIGAFDPGIYALIIRIQSADGSIVENELSTVHIAKSFRVLERNTNNPVENAKILLSLFNEQKKKYQEISPFVLSVKNPVYSETDGIVNIVLPAGKYRTNISNLGYKTAIVDFVIGPYLGQNYPTVYLEKESFNIITSTRYYLSTITDVLSETGLFLQNLSVSNRFFDLASLLILSLFVFLTILSFAHRLHIPLSSLPWHIHHILFQKPSANGKLKGRVTDAETDMPLGNVDIHLIDENTHKTIMGRATNQNGEFVFNNLRSLRYTILMVKNGYHPSVIQLSDEAILSGETQLLSLSVHATKRFSLKNLSIYIRVLLDFSFEILLFISICIELMLGYAQGFLRVIPFLVVSLGNLLLWVHYRKHTRKHEV